MLLPGIYRHPDGSIVRVRLTQCKSRVYSQTWRETKSGRRGATHEFTYTPEKIKGLTAADRMPLEEARAISRAAGQCLACARLLSDAKSLAEGVGPVCIKSFAEPQLYVRAQIARIEAAESITPAQRQEARVAKARASVRARLVGDRIIVISDYDDRIVGIIRSFDGAVWHDGRNEIAGPRWSLPREHAADLAEAFELAGIAHDDLALIAMGLAS